MINSMSILGIAYIWYIVQLNKYFAEINKKTKQNKTQISHCLSIWPKPNIKISEAKTKVINTNIHEGSLFLLGTGTSIYSGRAKLYLQSQNN